MHEALLIARREYVERIRSRAFRVSTVLIPMAFAFIFGIGALSGRLTGGPKHIVVASNDAGLANSERAELMGVANDGQLNVDVRAPITDKDLAVLNAEVEGKRLDGYLWLEVMPGSRQVQATYTSRGSADFVGRYRMQHSIGYALVRQELMRRGATGEEITTLLAAVDVKTLRVNNGRVETADASKGFWGAYLMAFILYFAVVFYGLNVAQSVVSEKTSRVFEVLLASAKPESLMLGKLLGVGAVGLTQMGVWIFFLLLLSASSLMTPGLGGLAAYGVTPLQLIFFVLYFLLGFFFYSALSAGLGATVSQESEVQQFSMLIVLPQMIGLMLIVYILSNPGAWPVVLLSLFPPCTPIVMCLRMAAMAVPAWQLALSVVLMVLSIYGMTLLASRIYRVGILMYGKRPTLPEMLRWLKYS